MCNSDCDNSIDLGLSNFSPCMNPLKKSLVYMDIFVWQNLTGFYLERPQIFYGASTLDVCEEPFYLHPSSKNYKVVVGRRLPSGVDLNHILK